MSRPVAQGVMRPFRELAPFVDAVAAARSVSSPLREPEVVPLEHAGGRVLATDTVAPGDVPSAHRSAMDGFAVRAADIVSSGSDRPTALKCQARIPAGHEPYSGTVSAGECVEVATGALLPRGADAVVPVEWTIVAGDLVHVDRSLDPGAHVCLRGEDLAAGAVVVAAGQVLRPHLVAALAAAGFVSVEVIRRPRVLLSPTGDEVVPLGEPLPLGAVHDSNALALRQLLESAGAEVSHGGIVGDERDVLVREITREGFDLIVTIGGTSVGRRDLVATVVGEIGEVLVHGVAVKPGKPLLVGRVNGRGVIGLPGFPASCLLLGYALLEPAVLRSAGLPPWRAKCQARLARDVSSPAGRTHLLTVRLDDGEAEPAFTGSSSVTSMSLADGWCVIDESVETLRAGAEIVVTLF